LGATKNQEKKNVSEGREGETGSKNDLREPKRDKGDRGQKKNITKKALL